MSKVLVFGAGIVTGILAVPVAVTYVKPVRKGMVRLGVSIYTFSLKTDSDFREVVVGIRDKIDQMLKEYPEEQ